MYIAHRINTVAELKDIPTEYGVELDIRDLGERLVLQHDPYVDGEDLESFLQAYHHGTLILNIKSERIEHKVLELVQKYNIQDYFFLDSSFPMIYLLSKQGEKNIALRFSEFEGMDTLESMQGKVEWVWVDCFTHLPINRDNYNILREWGYKLCLVSPELQGRDADIEQYKQYIEAEGIVFDKICTKVYNISRWNG
ncbi:phosphatidylinositol-specific phospholipase C/glycerophosphodiester phosphodiesterase family protein [Paenibacillus campi]|uniref:phosphatidylinositol-specific phospholipase C/glycerophosphodiester phosphodiesterase family protein n=1 Tax=Paenibacillus campi TaxID=3106031 RepID=UPI002AFF75C5|nr:phosphatidylinositol-specific phospholipase C/glycerophosphodiester phosphodiesterase family protein [Paenibacillus sp. SGZ-1014]